MNKKCKHYYLNISRKLNVTHVTEVSVRYDEDEQYHESTIRTEETSEWNITDYSTIKVTCYDCEKFWTGNKHEDFPKWLQEVLKQEEFHFKDL